MIYIDMDIAIDEHMGRVSTLFTGTRPKERRSCLHPFHVITNRVRRDAEKVRKIEGTFCAHKTNPLMR